MSEYVASAATLAAPIVVAITGASGAIYGIEVLRQLKEHEVPAHLIISKAASITITTETDYSLKEVQELATVCHNVQDIAAVISSGSYRTSGMIVAPCSAKTLACIACGTSFDLISRSADVTLKERRPLALLFRETPLHLTHIKNMQSVTEMGGIICSPVPAFYNKPKDLSEVVSYTILRVLDLFNLNAPNITTTTAGKRWSGK